MLIQLAGQRDLFRIINTARSRDRGRIPAFFADNEIYAATRGRIWQISYAAPRARLGAKININAVWIRRIRVALRLTLMVEPSDFDLFHG